MAQTRSLHRPPFHTVLEAYVNITGATYAAKAGDRVIGVNRAGTVTVTLPTAQLRPGRVYTVKDESGDASSNNITVATEGSETIDGSATDVIATNYGAKHYYSDGSNWFQVPLIPSPPHQAAHNSGGSDALKLDDLDAPEDNTDLNFSTSLHGLVPKGTGVGDFLKDDGAWAAVGSVLVSNLATGTRTAAAGSGTVNVTGAGFQPTAMIMLMKADSIDSWSIGFLDDDDDESEIGHFSDHGMVSANTACATVNDGSGNGYDVAGTFTSDGVDLVFTKNGSGQDVVYKLMFLR